MNYQLLGETSVDPNATIEQIEALLPTDQLDELSALGDQRDDTRWKVGDRAREWVDDYHLPVGQICKIIGKRADYGHERVRQFLYVSRYYHERPDLRQKYDLLRYSIFEYARGCSDPEAVLKAALENRLTPTQVKFTHLQIMDELKDTISRIPKQYEEAARSIVATALAKLKELAER